MKSSSSIFQNLKLKPVNSNNSKKNPVSNNTEQTNKLNAIKNVISNPIGVNITPEFDTKIIKMEKTKMPCNYLTNTLLSKIGTSFIIKYLGSAILTKGKTGLGCLQQPLRELYSIYRQNDPNLAQERRFGFSSDGLTMFFNECGVEKFLHNDLSSVYDIQLLKLVCEQRKDKKTYWAFLPDGEELDICYSNLFHPVDKLFNKSIEPNLSHPSLIALIMRRSTGIQALECHIMIAKSPCDAKQIVNGIKEVCGKYKQTLNQNTSVFQYTPYNEIKSSNNTSNETKSYEVDLNIINQLKQKEKYINQQSFLINQPNPTMKMNNNNNNNNIDQLPPKFPLILTNNKITESKDGKNVRDTSIDHNKSRSSSASNNNNNLKLNMQSKSSSNMSSSKSVFSKLKHNFMDKSSSHQKNNDSLSSTTTTKKEKKAETKQKNSIFNKLSSSSAVVFSETNNNKQNKELKKKTVSTKSTATSTDFDHLQHKRSSSALDNLIINDSLKKHDSNLLKNPSLISFNLDDGISSGIGNFSKANSTCGSKREKKPSLGKRLLMSARSSLKSNASVDIKQNNDQARALSSNSTTSLFSSKADKKKSIKDIGDIDFRKSKTSICDGNFIIDNKCAGNHHRSRRQSASSNVMIDETNRQSRAVTPNLIINSSTNRANANSSIDCCIYNHCRDPNFILKTRSPGPPLSCHHQLRHSPAHHSKSPFHRPQLRSVTPNSSTRIIFADKITKSSHSINNNSPIKLSSYCINTANSMKDEISSNHRSSSAVSVNRKQIPIETDVGVKSPALSYKSACMINQTKSKSNLNEYSTSGEMNKTYLTNDPRLFSNHLVWNKSKNTAESVDNKYSAPSSITVITTSNTDNPVVQPVSPCDGFISSSPNNNKTNSRSEIEIKIQTANIIPNSSPLLPPRPSSQYDAQLNKLNQTKAKLNNNIKETKSVLLSTSIDSAYNTNTSNEMDTEYEKVTIHKEKTEPATIKCCASNVSQNFEKFSPFFITETKKEFDFNSNNNNNSNNCCQGSIIDRAKLQHEEHQSSKKSTTNHSSSDFASTTTTSHKVIGGVKVFPSLPHQHKQAAEMRRQRLNAIEANLVEIENKSKINSADLNLGHSNSQFNLIQTTSSNLASSSTNNQEETTKSSSSQIYDFNNTSSSYKLLDDVNDTEIIDLTKKCKNLEIKTTTSSIVKKNETIETQSQNIQIEILTSDKMTKKDLDMDKYLFGDNIHTTNNNNNNKLKSTSIVIESPTHLNTSKNCNQKANFIYYYDNEHFGGY